MISNCGHDEHNRYHGGKAGDQTGGEYKVIPWYNRPWDHVLRPKLRVVGNRLANISKEAANNNNVGYDQYERKTYYTCLKAANWHPENIKKKCEADCSASTIANVIATGHQLDIKSLENLSPDVYTGNIRKALLATGQFEDLTASKYLTSDAYLLPGDILLYENHHVAVNLTTGSKASTTTTAKPTTTKTTTAKTTTTQKTTTAKKPAATTKPTTTTAKPTTAYYKTYTGKSDKIDKVLSAVGVPAAYRGSWKKRKAVAAKNGISNYTGTAAQNLKLITLAKHGKLKKV